VSWIVGLLVISPVYYLASQRRGRKQALSAVGRNA
jgi:NCS1 family nucleobase:cation symporter-1